MRYLVCMLVMGVGMAVATTNRTMRYLAGFVLALGLLGLPTGVTAQVAEDAPTSAALATHSTSHAPPQLMLRASYFYIPEHLEQRIPGHKHKKTAPERSAEPEKEQRSPGAKAGIFIGAILGAGLVSMGIATAVLF